MHADASTYLLAQLVIACDINYARCDGLSAKLRGFERSVWLVAAIVY